MLTTGFFIMMIGCSHGACYIISSAPIPGLSQQRCETLLVPYAAKFLIDNPDWTVNDPHCFPATAPNT